jgi:7-carboxy-7-deazaguanine synthase
VTYPISEIFFSLQGEGHFVGYPMMFLRLAGCSVRDCSIRKECDEAPWAVTERQTLDQILTRVSTSRIVCITGGEPTDHNLLPLVAALKERGHRVHLETSGVRSVEGWPLDWLTVSPKHEPESLIQTSGSTLKLVVRPEWSDETVRSLMDRFETCTMFFHRYLQPMTGANGLPTNLAAVMRVLLSGSHPWALSTQAHRVWSVR